MINDPTNPKPNLFSRKNLGMAAFGVLVGLAGFGVYLGYSQVQNDLKQVNNQLSDLKKDNTSIAQRLGKLESTPTPTASPASSATAPYKVLVTRSSRTPLCSGCAGQDVNNVINVEARITSSQSNSVTFRTSEIKLKDNEDHIYVASNTDLASPAGYPNFPSSATILPGTSLVGGVSFYQVPKKYKSFTLIYGDQTANFSVE